MSYLNAYYNTIEAFEAQLPKYFKGKHPMEKLIEESMLYSLEAGGKRIRPMLLLEFCHAYGGKQSEAYPFASAIEMIHTYSLIHDDLPCMDNDDLRRGKPTNHVRYGYDMAVLAGDALLNKASEIMIDQCLISDEPSLCIKAMAEIMSASGTKGMILGQVADIKMQSTDISVEDLDFINHHKTGKLLTASILAGAILGGASVDECLLIKEIGYDLGLLFQVVDDLLDVTGDVEKMGKRTQIDIQNDKTTYPLLLGIEQTKLRIEKMRSQLISKVSKLEMNSEFLVDTINFLSVREY